MSGHYPFDAFGNLLPGLKVVGGQVIAESGQVLHEVNAAAVNPAVAKTPEPEPLTPEPPVTHTPLFESDAHEADDATL